MRLTEFLVSLCLLGGGCSSQNSNVQIDAAAEVVLHNGIRLPDEWPPRYNNPDKPQEMPLPYLDKKPDVIPVNTGRQLFVDKFLIQETNLTPVYYTPRFYAGNPVLQADKDGELTPERYAYAGPFSDGIWYDEKEQKFKMWYLAGAGKVSREKHSLCTCYAESEDGKHWVKKDLGIVPGTNIVDTCNRDASTVWLDKNETNPEKRYKFFNIQYRPDYIQWQYVLKYSADGIHWSDEVAQSGAVSDRSTAFYNPFTKKWVLSMRHHNKVSWRSRCYLEHSDPEEAVSLAHRLREGIRDKHIVSWFTPDDKEKRHEKYPEIDPGIYNFDAIAYESIILGFYSQWQGPENSVAKGLMIPKRNEIMLGYSRDGFHFSRPSHEPFMGVNETEGAWNYGNMQSINGVPLIVGDSLYLYSTGRSLNKVWWDAGVSTGMAVLRRDGFVSMSTKEDGYLLTEKVTFNGKYVFVNADVKGKLLVEILDENKQPIKGYTKEECILMQGDNTKGRIEWKNRKHVSSLIGKNVYFKFYLGKGDLYAFWVSPWETGESRGYTAGGGPGLNESGIDLP